MYNILPAPLDKKQAPPWQSRVPKLHNQRPLVAVVYAPSMGRCIACRDDVVHRQLTCLLHIHRACTFRNFTLRNRGSHEDGFLKENPEPGCAESAFSIFVLNQKHYSP